MTPRQNTCIHPEYTGFYNHGSCSNKLYDGWNHLDGFVFLSNREGNASKDSGLTQDTFFKIGTVWSKKSLTISRKEKVKMEKAVVSFCTRKLVQHSFMEQKILNETVGRIQFDFLNKKEVDTYIRHHKSTSVILPFNWESVSSDISDVITNEKFLLFVKAFEKAL